MTTILGMHGIETSQFCCYSQTKPTLDKTINRNKLKATENNILCNNNKFTNTGPRHSFSSGIENPDPTRLYSGQNSINKLVYKTILNVAMSVEIHNHAETRSDVPFRCEIKTSVTLKTDVGIQLGFHQCSHLPSAIHVSCGYRRRHHISAFVPD